MSAHNPLSRRELLRRAAVAAGGAAAAGLALTPDRSEAAPPRSAAGHPPAAPPAAGGDITEKKIEDIVKGFDKLEGVLTLYRKKNDLYAEIRPDQLGKNMLLQATRSTGTAGVGGTVGDPLGDTVFFFRKENDQIYLVEPNLAYRAAKKTPEAASIQRSFADGYLAAFRIEAIRPDPKQADAIAALKDSGRKAEALDKAAIGYLIHIPTLFLT